MLVIKISSEFYHRVFIYFGEIFKTNCLQTDSSTLSAKSKNRPQGAVLHLAEREGFEPSVGYSPTPDFESGTFNRSATSPKGAHFTSKIRISGRMITCGVYFPCDSLL